MVGLVTTLLASLQLLLPVSSLLLLFPTTFLLLVIGTAASRVSSFSGPEKCLAVSLVLIWLIHSTGLLVPETGFDAVWYHLPVAQAMTEAQGFVWLTELYQSVNPLFSDLLFTLGLMAAGELGVKLTAFSLALTLLAVTYQLGRHVLSRYWSLWFILVVSLFQDVSWQSTSFYVDLAKAVWEVAALWLLVDHTLLKKRASGLAAGMMVGASIGTKFLSLILLPLFGFITTIIYRWPARRLILAIVGTVLVCGIFYLRTTVHTGTPLFIGQLHLNKLDEIGGHQSPFPYLWERTKLLPSSLPVILFESRDYVSIILLVFLPFLVLALPTIIKSQTGQALVAFAGFQYLVWWFLPPLSTRYAVSGFIILCLLLIWSVQKWCQEKTHYLVPLSLVLLLATGINVLPRLPTLQRNISYLSNRKPVPQYLQQFYDGNADQHLQRWHLGPRRD